MSNFTWAGFWDNGTSYQVNTFGTFGGTDTWNIMDTSNLIGWRISCIIGASYNSNLITIERLY